MMIFGGKRKRRRERSKCDKEQKCWDGKNKKTTRITLGILPTTIIL